MNEEFQRQIAQARREQIVDAAIAEVAEHGFQRATIKQIAARAGVADGTIYNYFENKDALLLGIMARLTEGEEREVQLAEAETMPFERFVELYVTHRMAEVDRALPVFKAILPETMVNKTLGQELNEQFFQPIFQIAESYFKKLMGQGAVAEADPEVAVRLFASPLFGLMLLRLLGDRHVETHWDQYREALTPILLKMFDSERTERDGRAESGAIENL